MIITQVQLKNRCLSARFERRIKRFPLLPLTATIIRLLNQIWKIALCQVKYHFHHRTRGPRSPAAEPCTDLCRGVRLNTFITHKLRRIIAVFLPKTFSSLNPNISAQTQTGTGVRALLQERWDLFCRFQPLTGRLLGSVSSTAVSARLL